MQWFSLDYESTKLRSKILSPRTTFYVSRYKKNVHGVAGIQIVLIVCYLPFLVSLKKIYVHKDFVIFQFPVSIYDAKLNY